MEWTPNSRYIYTVIDWYLYQVDTREADPAKKVRLIDTYHGTKDPFSTEFFLMAQQYCFCATCYKHYQQGHISVRDKFLPLRL